MKRTLAILAVAATLPLSACSPAPQSPDKAGDNQTPSTPTAETTPPPSSPGFGETPTRGFSELRFHGFDEAALSEAGRAGLTKLFRGEGFELGLPIKVAEGLAARERAHLGDDAFNERHSARGQFRAYGKLPSPPTRSRLDGSPANLSLGDSIYRRENSAFINNNCLACHSSAVAGLVVAGAGSSQIDQAALFQDAEHFLKLPESATDGLSDYEKKKWNEFLNTTRTTIATTFKFAQTRGENFGPFWVWKYMSRIADPETTGLQTLSTDQRTDRDTWFESKTLPPVDPNPWWLIRYKKSSYWNRDSKAGQLNGAHFSLNFTTEHPEVNDTHVAHVRTVNDILAFARDTVSPAYPAKLDEAAVKEGRQFFHGEKAIAKGSKLSCYKCHGSYSRDDAFTDLSLPGGWIVSYEDKALKDVGTDSAYSEFLRSAAPLVERTNKLSVFFARKEQELGIPLAPQSSVPGPQESGYLPPALVGVWASAPYFHNGSAPTLELVLNSKARRELKAWQRDSENPFAYDLSGVGLSYKRVSDEELTELKKKASDGDAKATLTLHSIYDTTQVGRTSTGHGFGDALTDSERRSVIEFLKSLSGPNIKSGG